MKKKDFFKISIMLIPAFVGYFINGYLGGMITGICLSILLLSTIGERVFYQANKKNRELMTALKNVIENLEDY